MSTQILIILTVLIAIAVPVGFLYAHIQTQKRKELAERLDAQEYGNWDRERAQLAVDRLRQHM